MWVDEYQGTNYGEKDCNFTVKPSPSSDYYPRPEEVELLHFRVDPRDDDIDDNDIDDDYVYLFIMLLH